MLEPTPQRQAQCDRVSAWSTALVAVVACLMLVLLVRVGQLKLRPDERLADASATASASRPQMARRGDLLDRRGRIIATSTVTHRLFVDAAVAEDPGTLAVELGRVIDLDPIAIDRKLHERPESRYVVIAEALDEWQVEAVRTAGLRGVGLEPRLERDHPHRELATALIGKVGFEHEGRSGLEFVFDRQLREDHGSMTELRDVRRKTLWINSADYEPGRDGGDVQLSLDMVIQQIAEARLRQAVLDHNAGGGRSVVIDCGSGEILAMCDVLNPRPGWEEQTEDLLRATDPALGRNRCVTDPYEPGSTFKPFIWATATAQGHARLDEELDTPTSTGYRTSYGRLIRDSHYYGPSTWLRVLVKSMNSGMAIVAERMSFAEMQGAVSRFGFGFTSGCGLAGETAGIVTPPEKWSKYTQSSVAMGHEIGVTPLQMVRAFSAFARDGTMPALRITKAGAADDHYRFVQDVIDRPMALTVRAALRTVMLDGTGRAAQSQQYEMFGKSGTAQLPKKEGGGYHEDRYVSSFIAGAPYEHPRIVVVVVIDDPDKSKGHYGGKIAGPAVRDIIDETLAYLGVRGSVD